MEKSRLRGAAQAAREYATAAEVEGALAAYRVEVEVRRHGAVQVL